MSELEALGRDYPFSIPPFFALILRAFSVIEGIALRVDPDYAIVQVGGSNRGTGGVFWRGLCFGVGAAAAAARDCAVPDRPPKSPQNSFCTTGVQPVHRAPAAVR